MNRLLLLALAAAALSAHAAAAQTRRTTFGVQLWPEAQAEVALDGSDYLLFSARGQQNTDNNGYAGTNRFLGFDQRRLSVGYEHFLSEHWSLGATLPYISFSKTYVLLPEVLLRHRSPVGPLTFGQRLNVEHLFPGQTGAKGATYARLRADLEKVLALGSAVALRPRLSYEAATHLRAFSADDNPDVEERTIQFTSLRGEVGVRLGPAFDFTPWFAYQTQYSFGLAQTDALGNVTIPAGRVNSVAPVVGLDLRFTFLNGQGAATRQQLPTQH
jgi:opacity protein-like surface antigen